MKRRRDTGSLRGAIRRQRHAAGIGLPVLAVTLVLMLVSSTATTGCTTRDDVSPVPDSVMIPVLADLHVAGARFRLEQDVPTSLRDSVLARHGLDSTQFAAATGWLEAHPDAFVALYGAVVDRLNESRNP